VGDCVSGVPAPHALGAAMGELARTLQHEHASEDATLEAVTAAAVEAVPGAEHAAISLVVRGRTVESRAATDPLAERMDAKQAELSQGPCLDAVWEQESVHIPDMAAESRWPQFTAAAVEGERDKLGEARGGRRLARATAGIPASPTLLIDKHCLRDLPQFVPLSRAPAAPPRPPPP